MVRQQARQMLMTAMPEQLETIMRSDKMLMIAAAAAGHQKFHRIRITKALKP